MVPTKVKDKSCIYFIAEMKDMPVGSVRFDMKNNEAIISYLVDSSWHGKGLGRILLAEGIKQLQKKQQSFNELVGFVLKENKASIHIFERMGFEKETEDGQIRYFKRVIHE